MNTKIRFTKNDKEYLLEYSRESVQAMERMGFDINELSSKPMTMLPLAFRGLFYKNHKYIKEKEVEEIYSQFKDRNKLIEAISTMLAETYNSLQENVDEEGNDKGNIDWEIV